mmetsp:Transcript_34586/g.58089  ORF Transcript_34586/g.58089 Transcript_34586/m.58089 type:complete len:219 (-) Transcript_34586:593-1249(-)|eukprot:CAMPEP_0198212038 /NCGR_PEP_ID=MMETSP1445-20131203/25487_1 /TAXON_ID=36898 /ORGANISM="Pyramimonas sp., Strain CCMP2087" /LENGTH=218 /DNA_ID=CAMNT_0043886409 /DNA_START=268 /DNA_END=927 /DNA_ORIENTATION=-
MGPKQRKQVTKKTTPAVQTKDKVLGSSLVADGSNIQAGDNIHVRAAKSQPSFIGRVVKLTEVEKQTASQTMVHVNWYYRPVDTLGGVKAFHGERELFRSDHLDVCELETIHGKCNVHKLKDYKKLERVGENDYYCRFSYKAGTGLFKPDRVPVYCHCEMPYNPDLFMVECEACAEWFHPECLGYSQKNVLELEKFICHGCKKTVRQQGRKGAKQQRTA